METTAQNKSTSTGYITHLYIIHGGLSEPTKREQRIEQFWTLCKAAFWSHEQFTTKEEAEFKQLLSAHFPTTENPDAVFHQLAQRVCLVKRYLNRGNGRYIAKPADWLNIHFQNGLSSTADWLLNVNIQRCFMPNYNEGIHLFADALLHFCEKKSSGSVQHFNKELIRLKQHDLQSLYHSVIAHLQFLN